MLITHGISAVKGKRFVDDQVHLLAEVTVRVYGPVARLREAVWIAGVAGVSKDSKYWVLDDKFTNTF